MRLIPAIDIRDGRCVRLLKGRFDQETRYDVDPIDLARRYRELGAEWLHVVDLDGAAQGAPANLPLVEAMRAENFHVQLGGGIRDRESLERALGIADRVVIGSLAATDPERVAGWLDEVGAERIVLGFDVRLEGDNVPFVATHGWTRTSGLTLAEAMSRYQERGLLHVLCTDIDRDGALAGPNLELYRRCAAEWPAVAFQASGGIRDAGDLEALSATGAAAAIAGKALLEGRIGEEEMQRFLRSA
ncbi:MAG TPA: 1-(5-phosphoribosyl)-5-[(5-phosphoribosylamino)methylideneamino]imidazole-4-carboxamide isomerase [Gammaproteobacteria bacterium]|nr:1-(5-phosphoribosyl)-5-[(5-phosphoribosylamino)methylideneamino]imidazole-4-carboxamide isomerase [Gammaproteobacteria bacterium]